VLFFELLKINLWVDFMKLVSIFVGKLYAFHFKGEEQDEFRRLFNLWFDPEYLVDFFEKNIKDISNGYYGTYSVEEASLLTNNIAESLENKLLDLAHRSESEQSKGLDQIFYPLYNEHSQIRFLNESKVRNFWLRIYALRVDYNIYIITGGAIKLTRTMQERPHTMHELEKLKRCRSFLLSQGIVDHDGIIEELEI
jgi:hypothetical protein